MTEQNWGPGAGPPQEGHPRSAGLVVGPGRGSPRPSQGESPDGQVRQPVQDQVEGDGQALRVAELWRGGQLLVPGGPRRLA